MDYDQGAGVYTFYYRFTDSGPWLLQSSIPEQQIWYGAKLQNPRVGIFMKSWNTRNVACDFSNWRFRNANPAARQTKYYAPATSRAVVVPIARYAMYTATVVAVAGTGRRSDESAASATSPVFWLKNQAYLTPPWSWTALSARLVADSSTQWLTRNIDWFTDMSPVGATGQQSREGTRAALVASQLYDRAAIATFNGRFLEVPTGFALDPDSTAGFTLFAVLQSGVNTNTAAFAIGKGACPLRSVACARTASQAVHVTRRLTRRQHQP